MAFPPAFRVRIGEVVIALMTVALCAATIMLTVVVLRKGIGRQASLSPPLRAAFVLGELALSVTL